MPDSSSTAPANSAAASNLERTLAASRFAITAEVVPPTSCDPGAVEAEARPLAGLADAVNVTDNPRARPHMCSLAAAAILVRAGIEPVMQMVCRDRNRIALQSDLLGAAALGVSNVLALRGDPPGEGSEPDAAGVFDTDSDTLTRIALKMSTHGLLASDRKLKSRPNFFMGVADLPVAQPSEEHLQRLANRAALGARFVQTQFCFDLDVARSYAAALRAAGITDKLHLLIGIGPLASARSARWMRDNLYGTTIPDRVVERMESAADPKAEGVEICAELLRDLADTPGISGAHIMCPGDASLVPEAIRRSGMRG